MRHFIFLLIISLCAVSAYPQSIPDSAYETQAMHHLMALLNLTPNDISFRQDYTEVDSFRLESVAHLMDDPYDMVRYSEQFKDIYGSDDLTSMLEHAYENVKKESQLIRYTGVDEDKYEINFAGINLFFNNLDFNRLLMKTRAYLNNIIPAAKDSMLYFLSSDEKKFLYQEFKQIMLEDTADENKPVEVLDSIQQIEEEYVRQFTEFGFKIRKDFLLEVGIGAAVDIFDELDILMNEIEAGNTSLQKIYDDTTAIPDRVGIATYLGKNDKWKIGGFGNDYHKGEYDLIIDFGGNDKYDLSYDVSNPHGTIIIDFSGDDIYSSSTDFCIGSGAFSIGILYDFKGDDIYNGKHFSCGSGYFGMGILYDAGGNDVYNGDTHTEGAGTFGIGMIIDDGGTDVYSGHLYAQGFALTEGYGVIVDRTGNDNYFAGGKYGDILRYDDHYLSLSQGFAYGIRPYMSGGIGAILDYDGNDNYMSDIFGQGASYWWALGMIYDVSGNDQYISYQYAQGSGTHMSVGMLLDESGDDFYRGKGLMQGCGHDYACGFILDRNGNDIYQADDLSQGAGSANGIGILLDTRGNDAFYVLKTHNTQGYGNPRRDYGSIGLFVDMGGTDQYKGNGFENGFWKTDSKWGGGMDLEFIKIDTSKAEQGEPE